jgi:hypothetical protein
MAMINNVNHKNMIVIWHFLKGYAEENKLKENDVNIFEMLNLPFPEKYQNALNYFTDPTQWSPLETYVQCYRKTKEVTGDSQFRIDLVGPGLSQFGQFVFVPGKPGPFVV